MRIPNLILIALAFLLGWIASSALDAYADEPAYIYPVIKDHGKVVAFPDAAAQPRDGSRILVDLTGGGDPKVANSAIEKVARFVNIYAGAGAKPASAKIAVVLHGDATLTCLHDEAYSKRFGASNPNLALMRELKKAGVKFYVCGQSLTGKGAVEDEVDKTVEFAVSGLSAMVNLQQDGYAYIPLQ